MLKAEFIKSAVWSHDFPETRRPEIAMVGRSNAGKSSLVNAMIGPTNIAKVSATPGKTRLLNFFNVGEHYSLVDLPGYGFAKGGKAEYEIWNRMISRYFELRETLVGMVLICDIRRQWTADEQMILNLANQKKIKMICVLNKTDKLTRDQINKQLTGWVKTSKKSKDFFHQASVLKKTGVIDIENFIFNNWIKKI